MPSLADIRKQYPNLSKLTDYDVASLYAQEEGISPETAMYELGVRQEKSSGLMGDLWRSGKQFVHDVQGEMVPGLLDFVTGTAIHGERPFSKGAQRLGEITGYQPGRWAEELEQEKSAGYQASKADIDAAWGEIGEAGLADQVKEMLSNPEIAAAYATNPAYTLNAVVRSLGPSLGIAAAARQIAKRAAVSAPLAAGVAEGGYMTGAQLGGYDPDAPNQREAAGLSLATGVVGGLTGFGGAKLARRAGLTDIETAFVGNTATPTDMLAGLARRPMSHTGRIAGGAAAEGLFEELPQTLFEGASTNVMEGRDWQHNLARTGLEGALAGGVMGGVFNVPGRSRSDWQRDVADANELAQDTTMPVGERQKAMDFLRAVPEQDMPYAKVDNTTPTDLLATQGKIATAFDAAEEALVGDDSLAGRIVGFQQQANAVTSAQQEAEQAGLERQSRIDAITQQAQAAGLDEQQTQRLLRKAGLVPKAPKQADTWSQEDELQKQNWMAAGIPEKEAVEAVLTARRNAENAVKQQEAAAKKAEKLAQQQAAQQQAAAKKAEKVGLQAQHAAKAAAEKQAKEAAKQAEAQRKAMQTAVVAEADKIAPPPAEGQKATLTRDQVIDYTMQTGELENQLAEARASRNPEWQGEVARLEQEVRLRNAVTEELINRLGGKYANGQSVSAGGTKGATGTSAQTQGAKGKGAASATNNQSQGQVNGTKTTKAVKGQPKTPEQTAAAAALGRVSKETSTKWGWLRPQLGQPRVLDAVVTTARALATKAGRTDLTPDDYFQGAITYFSTQLESAKTDPVKNKNKLEAYPKVIEELQAGQVAAQAEREAEAKKALEEAKGASTKIVEALGADAQAAVDELQSLVSEDNTLDEEKFKSSKLAQHVDVADLRDDPRAILDDLTTQVSIQNTAVANVDEATTDTSSLDTALSEVDDGVSLSEAEGEPKLRPLKVVTNKGEIVLPELSAEDAAAMQTFINRRKEIGKILPTWYELRKAQKDGLWRFLQDKSSSLTVQELGKALRRYAISHQHPALLQVFGFEPVYVGREPQALLPALPELQQELAAFLRGNTEAMKQDAAQLASSLDAFLDHSSMASLEGYNAAREEETGEKTEEKVPKILQIMQDSGIPGVVKNPTIHRRRASVTTTEKGAVVEVERDPIVGVVRPSIAALAQLLRTEGFTRQHMQLARDILTTRRKMRSKAILTKEQRDALQARASAMLAGKYDPISTRLLQLYMGFTPQWEMETDEKGEHYDSRSMNEVVELFKKEFPENAANVPSARVAREIITNALQVEDAGNTPAKARQDALRMLNIMRGATGKVDTEGAAGGATGAAYVDGTDKDDEVLDEAPTEEAEYGTAAEQRDEGEEQEGESKGDVGALVGADAATAYLSADVGSWQALPGRHKLLERLFTSFNQFNQSLDPTARDLTVGNYSRFMRFMDKLAGVKSTGVEPGSWFPRPKADDKTVRHAREEAARPVEEAVKDVEEVLNIPAEDEAFYAEMWERALLDARDMNKAWVENRKQVVDYSDKAFSNTSFIHMPAGRQRIFMAAVNAYQLGVLDHVGLVRTVAGLIQKEGFDKGSRGAKSPKVEFGKKAFDDAVAAAIEYVAKNPLKLPRAPKAAPTVAEARQALAWAHRRIQQIERELQRDDISAERRADLEAMREAWISQGGKGIEYNQRIVDEAEARWGEKATAFRTRLADEALQRLEQVRNTPIPKEAPVEAVERHAFGLVKERLIQWLAGSFEAPVKDKGDLAYVRASRAVERALNQGELVEVVRAYKIGAAKRLEKTGQTSKVDLKALNPDAYVKQLFAEVAEQAVQEAEAEHVRNWKLYTPEQRRAIDLKREIRGRLERMKAERAKREEAKQQKAEAEAARKKAEQEREQQPQQRSADKAKVEDRVVDNRSEEVKQVAARNEAARERIIAGLRRRGQQAEARKSARVNTNRVLAALAPWFPTAQLFSNKVVVFETAAEARAMFPEVFAKADAKGTRVQGFHYGKTGQVVLIAQNIASGNELGVTLHEVGVHYGLERVLGKERMGALYRQIKQWADTGKYNADKAVAKAARSTTHESRRHEEVIAYFVEMSVNAGTKPDAPAELKTFFGKLFDAVAKFLREVGMARIATAVEKLKTFDSTDVNASKMTRKDVVELVYGAALQSLAEDALPKHDETAYAGNAVFTRSGKNLYGPVNLFHGVTIQGGEHGDIEVFDVADPDTGEVMGLVALGFDENGNPNALYNIKAVQANSGFGENTLKAVLQAATNGIHVVNILPDAVGFWKAMGTRKNDNYARWEHAHGYLNYKNYSEARSDKDGSLYEQAVARAKGSQEGGQAGAADYTDLDFTAFSEVDSPLAVASRGKASQIWTDAKESARKMVGQLTYMHTILKRIEPHIESAKSFRTAVDTMAEMRKSIEHKVEQVAAQASKVSDLTKVNELIALSTTKKEWAYGPKATGEAKAMFDKLSAKEQAVIRAVFDHGAAMLKLKREILKSVDMPEVFLKNIGDETAPYAPLKRFGDYVVIAKSAQYLAAEKANNKQELKKLEVDPEHYNVSRFSTKGAAAAERNKLSKKFPWTDEFYRGDTAKSGQLAPASLAKLLAAVKATTNSEMPAESRAAMENFIRDMYFAALDEANARHASQHRRVVPGFDKDMMRAFVSHGMAEAALLSNLKHGGEVNAAYNKMHKDTKGKDGRRVAMDDMTLIDAHYQANLKFEDTPWQDAAVAMTSAWQLATSVGYHVTNATQGFMVTLPRLAADFDDYTGAWKHMMAGYNALGQIKVGALGFNGIDINHSFFKGKPGLRAAFETAINRDLLDVGMTEDNSILMGTRTGYAVLDKTTKAGARALHQLRKASRMVEVWNRVAAGYAAYTMAKSRGRTDEQAKEYMLDMLENTQGDFTRSGAPLALKKLPKVITQYRKYQLMMAALYSTAFSQAFLNEDKQVRAMGRRMLAYKMGHTFMAAGVLGLPMMNLVGMIWGAIGGGGGDEPPDLERSLVEAGVPQAMLRGPLNLIGLDMSSKLGDDKIFSLVPYTDWDFSKEGLTKLAGGLLGPGFGLLGKFGDGVQLIMDGQYAKGVEKTLPRGMETALQSFRYANEGYTMKNGDVMVAPEDLSAFSLLLNGLGMPSTDLKYVQWIRGQQFEIEKYYAEKTTALERRYREVVEEDGAASPEAREIHQEWMSLQNSKDEVRWVFNDAPNKLKKRPLSDLLKFPREAAKREKARQQAFPAL